MNYEINDRVFVRLDELEVKKFGRKINDSRPEQILRAFPNEDILQEQKALSFLEKETGLDESTIVNSLNTLIKDKKLITAFDTKNRLHLRKMKYL